MKIKVKYDVQGYKYFTSVLVNTVLISVLVTNTISVIIKEQLIRYVSGVVHLYTPILEKL